MVIAFRNSPGQRTAPELIECHVDEPIESAFLKRPQLALKGWLAFDRPVNLQDLIVTVRFDSHSYRVGLDHRPDVSAAHPKLFTTGFRQLIALTGSDIENINNRDSDVVLQIEYLEQSFSQSLHLEAEPAISNRSSYYHVSDFEHFDSVDSSPLSPLQKANWRQRGYVVIEDFYANEEIDKLNEYIEKMWISRQNLNWPITIDEYIGTNRERRRLFVEASEAVRERPYKINDLYLVSETIRKIVLSKRLADVLSGLLYAGSPMICSSLYFEKGSQQEKHFDTFFMPPLLKNRMLATWIALEDVTEPSGPLDYYPGSHNIEPWVFSDGRYNLLRNERADCYNYIDSELERRSIKKERFLAKKGDLFIWHPQLLHGGGNITDANSTRRSLVTHYFCREDHAPEDSVEFSAGCFYLNRDYLV